MVNSEKLSDVHEAYMQVKRMFDKIRQNYQARIQDSALATSEKKEEWLEALESTWFLFTTEIVPKANPEVEIVTSKKSIKTQDDQNRNDIAMEE
jgi:hypothetical protein